MPDPASIASRIAQMMSQGAKPPEAEAAVDPMAPPATTLTPEYKNQNKADIAKTMPYSPENDYNAKLKKFFGLAD